MIGINSRIKKIFFAALPIALGGLGGYLYWNFIGCATGSCPLTSHWWTSTAYGVLIGLTFLLPKHQKTKHQK